MKRIDKLMYGDIAVGVAAAVGAYFLLRPKDAAAAASPTKKLIPMKPPRVVLPSKQLPKPTPLVEPTPPPVDPPEWEFFRGLQCGGSRILVSRRVDPTGTEWSWRLQNNGFLQRYQGYFGWSSTGYDTEVEAINAARTEGYTSGMCVDNVMLRNDETPTGREVAYWDGRGVEMTHVADPLSPTGVTVEWSTYAHDDSPMAQGSAPTEAGALDMIEETAI